MDIPRRQFLLTSGSLVSGAAFSAQQGRLSNTPWYEKMRRVGLHDANERDPLVDNIDEWIDFWASLKVDVVILNGAGMMAFYPTKIPLQHKSQFLGDRDYFGDYSRAAKKRGMRVIIRVDPKSMYGDMLRVRPDWFVRDSKGNFVPRDELAIKGAPPRDEWIYWTCMFSSYFTEQIPAILRELNSLYDFDGFFMASWPTSTKPRLCYCDACRRLGDPKGPAYYDHHTRRTLEIVRLWDSIAREKNPDNLYVVNMNGSIVATQDLKKLSEGVRWLNCDHQARRDHQGHTGDAPIWHCAQSARVVQSLMKGRPTTIGNGSNSTTRLLWRHVAKSDAEVTLWWAQVAAGGSVPWCAWLGHDPEDQRWREPARQFFQWHARHEAHFVNRRPIANLGVVFSQRTNAFYVPPEDVQSWEYLQGLYYALLEGRFLFDFVHDEDLGPETLKKYSALILPNIAALSDEQAAQLRKYVEAGGSLLATFETGLFDRDGKPRADFAVGDLFGIRRAGERQGALGTALSPFRGHGDLSSFYCHIERKHEILSGFEGTTLLPGAEYYIPVRASSDPIMTVVPPYPGHPPEMVYPRTPHTNIPAIVVSEKGRSRLVYFPGDIDRSCWKTGHTDISLLIQNSVRWILRNQTPVTVTGEGMAEVFAWETEPGFAIHILNYNNPNLTYGWLRRHYPIGPQTVRLQLPDGVRISRAELLRAESGLSYKQTGRTVEFVIPRVKDYEVAALCAAARG
ncbi:MAG: alpha-amylase family protein [Bryobacteraceae bacterium]|jgi:hypothetical protein